MFAKVSTYPSLTWHSICGTRDLLKGGLVWRIGNGDSVHIWNDPWLSGHENPRISVQFINTSWIAVSQLIDKETFT